MKTTVNNLVLHRAQRRGDIGLVAKVLSLRLDHDERIAFERMRRSLGRDTIVLQPQDRAWGHRLIKRLGPKKSKVPTGDRSPVVSKEANRTMRKIDRWLEQQRGPVPAATGDRSPVVPTSDKPKRPSDTKRKRLAKRRENRPDRWIDTHPGGTPSTPPGCP